MRRSLLFFVAALLTASALLAVGVLLFGGHFGRTQGRILGTTATLAGFGVLGVPAATLFDRRLLRGLAALDAALATAGAALALVAIWSAGSETLGKSVATVTVALVGVAQTAALAARRTDADPRLVRLLFAASVALACAAVVCVSLAVWTDAGDTIGRVVGAVVVLDLLCAALQPILARARPAEEERTRLRLQFASGEVRELSVRGHVERVELEHDAHTTPRG